MNPPVPLDTANALMSEISTDWTVVWSQFRIEEDDGSVTIQWGYRFRFDGETAPQMYEPPELHLFPDDDPDPLAFRLACLYVAENGFEEIEEVGEA